jgi:hypothetical protein
MKALELDHISGYAAEFHVLRKPIALFIDGKSLQMRGIGGEQS